MSSLFFVLVSIGYYIFSPNQYNLFYVQLVSLTFLLQTIPFVYKKSKGHYLNFYFLFFFSYYFINFFYASVLYPIDPEYFSIFTLSTFDVSLINKATSLAFVSSSFLILGVQTSFLLSKGSKREKINNDLKFNHFNLTIISTITVLLFLATVGKQFLSGDFTGQSSVSLYILQLSLYMLIITSVALFRSFNEQKNKKIYYAVVLLFCSVFLLVGDRGPALSILLVIASLYTYYVKRFNLFTVLVGILFGVVLMHIIGEGRTVSPNSNENIFIAGLQNFSLDLEGLYQASHSFVVNSFTLYAGIDYTQKNGLSYGSNNLIYILSLFPFLQSLLISALDIELQTSASILTIEYLGQNPPYGLGTNLISDIYMSFGFAGCILCFYLLGLFIEKVRLALIKSNTMPLNIVYFTLVSVSVSWPRAGYLMPLKAIIWSIAIYYVLRLFSFIKPMRH